MFESLVLSWYTAQIFLAQTVCLRCLLGPSSNQARQHLVRAVRVRKVPAGVEANIQAVLCTQKYYQYSSKGTSSTGMVFSTSRTIQAHFLVRAVLSGTREVELKYLPVLTQTSWPYFVLKNTTSTAQTVRVVPAADEVRMKGFAF